MYKCMSGHLANGESVPTSKTSETGETSETRTRKTRKTAESLLLLSSSYSLLNTTVELS